MDHQVHSCQGGTVGNWTPGLCLYSQMSKPASFPEVQNSGWWMWSATAILCPYCQEEDSQCHHSRQSTEFPFTLQKETSSKGKFYALTSFSIIPQHSNLNSKGKSHGLLGLQPSPYKLWWQVQRLHLQLLPTLVPYYPTIESRHKKTIWELPARDPVIGPALQEGLAWHQASRC